MPKFEITYGVVREGVVIVADNIAINLTKKDLTEIEESLVAKDYSPFLADLPERIYKRCCKKALEAGTAHCQENGIEVNDEMAVGFCEILPLCIADALTPEVATRVKANMQDKLPELFA